MSKGQQSIQTITIMGREFWLPPHISEIDGKKVEFWPDDLVFHVYEPNGPPIWPTGCTARLDVARRWMRKRGRVLHVDIDYRPRKWPYWHFVARIVIARIGRRDLGDLKIEYAGKTYE